MADAHAQARDPSKDFDTLKAANNTSPIGLWSEIDILMYVVDSVDGVYHIYSIATKTYVTTFGLSANNTQPAGIWGGSGTVWVADWFDGKIYAYNLTAKTYDKSKDFDTLAAAGNTSPAGLWSDGTTMWVADWFDGKIYAYNLATKAHDKSKDFDTLKAANNTVPQGIWSDGTTMWVTDNGNDKLYAYKMSDKSRDKSKDFDTLKAAGNTSPIALWSGAVFDSFYQTITENVMWVADSVDAKIYAYEMPRDPEPEPDTSTGNGTDTSTDTGYPVTDTKGCDRLDASIRPANLAVSDNGWITWSYTVRDIDVPYSHYVRVESGTEPPADYYDGVAVFDAECTGAECRAHINGFWPDLHYLVAVDSTDRERCGYDDPALARHTPAPPSREPPAREPATEPPRLRMSATDDWDYYTVTVDVLSPHGPLAYDWGHDGDGDLRYTSSPGRVTYECGWDAVTVHVRVTDVGSGLSSGASAAVCDFDGEPAAPEPEPEPEPPAEEPPAEPPTQEPEPDPEPPRIRMSVTNNWSYDFDEYTVTADVLSPDSPHLAYDWGHDGSGDLVYGSSPGRVTYECGWDDSEYSSPDYAGVTVHVRVTDLSSGLSTKASVTVCYVG